MTPDPQLSSRTGADLGDDALAALVRATAEDWTLPPQRLDGATWRDRIDPARAGRRGWLPRLAAPVSAAAVITVVVAFAAVWLNAPRSAHIAGASPSPSDAVASPSTGATATTLPKVAVNGILPDPATVLVRDGSDYRLADLATGTLGGTVFGPHDGPTTVIARPGGGWLCVCSDWVGADTGHPAGMVVNLVTADPSGVLGSETLVRRIDGRPVPGPTGVDLQQVVDAHASVSRDGRFAFLGWASREGGEGWKLGIDVIDAAAGRVVGSTGLPMLPSATAAGDATTRVAPDVDLAASGDAVSVSDFWYVSDDRNPPPSGVDRWSASFDGTTLSGLSPMGGIAGDACVVLANGIVDASSTWALCSMDGRLSTGARFDRIGRDGATIGSTDLPVSYGLAASQVDRSGRQLFVWSPVARTLVRIDIATGTLSSVTGATAAVATDPMADVAGALGRWIAPPALAKVLLDPALVISPDGTRVYALGTDTYTHEKMSSLGVFVFDAATMQQVGHWQPAADLTSIAVSPDGAWLYAAGQPGFSASGAATGDPASVTVYATGDGSVRLTAGRLGYEAISFPRPLVP